MKTTHIIAGFILASITSPIAFADNSSVEMPKELLSGDFCSNITKIESLSQIMGQRLEQFDSKTKSKTEDRSEKRDDRDEKRDGKRDDRDQTSSLKFDSLRKQATTDAEKTAVETFITSVTKAESVKRAALDTLIAQERTAIDAKITEKTGLSATAMAELKAKMDAAIAKAKTDCANKVDSNTVKAEFKKTLESARSTLKNVKDDKTIQEEIKKYHEAHKADVQKIEDTFKASLESAKAELIKTLPNAKVSGEKKGILNKIKNIFNKKESGKNERTDKKEYKD